MVRDDTLSHDYITVFTAIVFLVAIALYIVCMFIDTNKHYSNEETFWIYTYLFILFVCFAMTYYVVRQSKYTIGKVHQKIRNYGKSYKFYT